MKVKWVVQPAPTGAYRSFQHRGWPHAETADGTYLGQIRCEDDYNPPRARGECPHRELSVAVADHRKPTPGWEIRILKKKFSSLVEAKRGLEAFLNAHPEVLVKGQR